MKIRITTLDKLFSHYIKLRDKWCQRCGGSGGLQTAHFHSRRKRSVRYDPDNLCLLCFGCHIYLDGNPLEKIEFFKQKLGQESFDMLNSRARIPARYIDKNAITLYLKEQLKNLTEAP